MCGCGSTSKAAIAKREVEPIPHQLARFVVPPLLPAAPTAPDKVRTVEAVAAVPKAVAKPAAKPRNVFAQPLVDRRVTRAIILMYHTIYRSRSERAVQPYVVEQQIIRLRRMGVEIIRLSQLVDFLYGKIERLPARVAVITIDDGEATFFKYALPRFVRQKAPFALGIITKAANSNTEIALNWHQLALIMKTGLCEIASHGHNHVGLGKIDSIRRRYELVHSRNEIERHLGVRPDVFIYPLGSLNKQAALQVRRAGYRAALAAVGATFDSSVWRYKIPRFDVRRSTALSALKLWFTTPLAEGPPRKFPLTPPPRVAR